MNFSTDQDGRVYQLQKCPFCGRSVASIWSQSERDEYKVEPERYTVVCGWSQRGCGANCGWHETVEEAVQRWNSRVVI